MRRLLLPCLLAVSCSPLKPTEDAGIVVDAGSALDAGPEPDAGAADAGTPDAGEPDAGETDAGAPDAGEPDAGRPDAGPVVPLAGFGAISGACGPLSLADLQASTPSTFETRLDFAMLTFDAGALSQGGQRMYATPNAGGSSAESEVFAYEVLYRCELADLVATETEVTYTPPTSKKTDLVVSIEGEVLGVSVARAFKFPPGTPLSVVEAKSLLEGKFSDILISSQNVNPPYRWRKQLLHVIAFDDVARQAVFDAAATIDPQVRADTILYVTVTDGDDAFIY